MELKRLAPGKFLTHTNASTTTPDISVLSATNPEYQS